MHLASVNVAVGSNPTRRTMPIEDLISKERIEKLEEIKCSECGYVFLAAPTEEKITCENHPI